VFVSCLKVTDSSIEAAVNNSLRNVMSSLLYTFANPCSFALALTGGAALLGICIRRRPIAG
jgi:ABC-type microcin C transport system permease subunit YejE